MLKFKQRRYFEPNASTVLSRETSTSTPLFYINEPTLGTGGAIGTEIEKEIKKKQKSRVSIDQLVDSNIICSKDDVTKSYNSSTRYDEEQYIKNVPTKISNKNIGNVHRQYDHKLQNVKNKNKKKQFHRKKKIPLPYTNLPVLETITTKLSSRERQNNISEPFNNKSQDHITIPVITTLPKHSSSIKKSNQTSVSTSNRLESNIPSTPHTVDIHDPKKIPNTKATNNSTEHVENKLSTSKRRHHPPRIKYFTQDS